MDSADDQAEADLVAADDSPIRPELFRPPTDRRKRDAWLLRKQDAIAALMAAEAARIARTAVERYAEGVLTAAGDISALDGMERLWASYLSTEVAPQIAGMYLSGGMSAWLSLPGAIPAEVATRWAAVVNEAAVAYQASATNRIVNASLSTWQDVRDKTVVALRDGVTNEELKSSIQAVTQYSEFRADTIGRTETIAAYNGGDIASARALGEYGPTAKRWLATLDSRTRETHVDADGQTVPLAEPFIVGGDSLDYPVAPGGSPGEVINCRCTVEYLYPGDEDMPRDFAEYAPRNV